MCFPTVEPGDSWLTWLSCSSVVTQWRKNDSSWSRKWHATWYRTSDVLLGSDAVLSIDREVSSPPDIGDSGSGVERLRVKSKESRPERVRGRSGAEGVRDLVSGRGTSGSK